MPHLIIFHLNSVNKPVIETATLVLDGEAPSWQVEEAINYSIEQIPNPTHASITDHMSNVMNYMKRKWGYEFLSHTEHHVVIES